MNQLLIHLPRLPFTAVFDILFRHGGFAAFVAIFGGRHDEAMYQFWRMYFVSSPVGKIHPVRIGQWVQVMCACHIVQSLPHPAHAVYLLRPMRHEIPESVSAWAVAGGGGNQLLQPEILIRAMRIFLPTDNSHPLLLQNEWFWVADVHKKRSLDQWLGFADEVIRDHAFTQHWWEQQREGPSYMLPGFETMQMGTVIARLARREMEGLMRRLLRGETDAMRAQLEEKRRLKQFRKEAEEKKEEERKAAASSSGKKKQSSSSDRKGGKKGKPSSSPPPPPPSNTPKQHPPAIVTPPSPSPPVIVLSQSNKQEIQRLATLRFTRYNSTLMQVKTTLSAANATVLDKNLRRIMSLVVSLSHRYPRIKWSIRLAMHEVAAQTGMSVWDVERALYRLRYRKEADPLAKLMKLVGKNKNESI